MAAALASAGISMARADESESPLVVELSLLDAPRVGDLDGLVPTWRQASELSQGFVELGHFAVHQGTRRLGRVRLPIELIGVALFTYLAYGFAGGPGWADLPVEFRDFTGPDCTAWVYDLARPDEPYAARGAFPDGGVRRPRATADLSQDERDFLALNRSLALLNFVDPIALDCRRSVWAPSIASGA